MPIFQFNSSFLRFAARHYFHGSTQPLRPGTVLQPGKGMGLQNDPAVGEYESYMEQAKPDNKISRQQCVFMCSRLQDIQRAGGGTHYIYEVQPLGQVDMSDQAWYGYLSFLRHPVTSQYNEEAFEIAMNYWEGIPYPDKAESLWEYRTPKAKVLRRVK